MTQFKIDPKTEGILPALRCPKHPRYKALRKPTRRHPCDKPCKTCWKLYRLRHP
jgi:hypothetical protein